MSTKPTPQGFFVWQADQTIQGPLELPALVDWITGGRVVAGTWVYACRNRSWQQAKDIPELLMFFGKRRTREIGETSVEMDASVLRRVRVLAPLTDEQLVRFAQFMEILQAPQWATVVRQGEHGNAMFLILEGELRARLLVGDRESTLATFGPGDFFGEISLLDEGLRSADVVANEESTLLKVTITACHALAREAPDIAAAFLLGVGKTLAARIRADNKRLHEAVSITYTISL